MDELIGGWRDGVYGSHLMGVSIDSWQQPFDGWMDLVDGSNH